MMDPVVVFDGVTNRHGCASRERFTFEEAYMAQVAVSIVILTKNEEALIERAITSVQWAQEILILDSGSTDRTCEIARSLGAVVHMQPWLGWTEQHKRGAELASNPWILTIDADEIVTEKLRHSIESVMSKPPNPKDGYVVDRRDDFVGRLVFSSRRRAKRDTFIRLFNREFSGYDENMRIHEEIRSPGRAIKLEGLLLHCRDSSITEIIDTYNKNSNIEAEDIVRKRAQSSFLPILMMPLLRFLWVYIRCGNWRLGTHGLVLAYMYALSEILRQVKAWEVVYRMNHPRKPDYSIKG